MIKQKNGIESETNIFQIVEVVVCKPYILIFIKVRNYHKMNDSPNEQRTDQQQTFFAMFLQCSLLAGTTVL